MRETDGRGKKPKYLSEARQRCMQIFGGGGGTRAAVGRSWLEIGGKEAHQKVGEFLSRTKKALLILGSRRQYEKCFFWG